MNSPSAARSGQEGGSLTLIPTTFCLRKAACTRTSSNPFLRHKIYSGISSKVQR